MRSDCISHPAKERILIIREWQIEFCKGDRVAAALLSFFEYWHSIKLAAGVELYQYHTEDQLVEGILGLGDRERIRCAINFLELTKCITIQGSPDRFFLFHPEVLTEYILTAKKSLHPLSGVNPVRIEQSVNSRDNKLPDHAIAYPAMLSSVQKTEDRFHPDRNYSLKLKKFVSVWNENKLSDWLVITLDKGGAFKTQLAAAMKRYEGTVEELEKELGDAIAYAKTTKEAQKSLTALDLCNYNFSKLAEWSAKWKARHQPKLSIADNNLSDGWMDKIQEIYEENQQC